MRLPEYAERYRAKVEEKIEEQDIEGQNQTDQVGWDNIAEVVTEAAKEVCGTTEKKKKNPG